MSNDLYRVIFQGETDPGFQVDEVKKNLADLFKAPPEKIDKLFSGSPVPIKKNVDHPTALKYQAAMKRAGAISLVLPMERSKKSSPEAHDNVDSTSPQILDTEKVRGKLAFSPVLCSSISGNTDTFDLNRVDMNDLPLSAVRLVSVFREQPDPDGPVTDSIALFIEGYSRPFLVTTDHIRFGGFPDVAGTNLVQSVQNFIRFLTRCNPGMYIDHETETFLAESQYLEIINQLDHLTALGEALDPPEGV